MEATTRISRGDCFVFNDNGVFRTVVAVVQHKDNKDLWYCVAADGRTDMVGTLDVEVEPSNPLYPMVLRCNVGFWFDGRSDSVVATATLEKGTEGPLAEKGLVDAAGDAAYRLHEMVAGNVPQAKDAVATENTAGYAELMAKTAQWAGAIEASLNAS